MKIQTLLFLITVFTQLLMDTSAKP